MNKFAWIGYYTDRNFFYRVSQLKKLTTGIISEKNLDDFILNLEPLELLFFDDIYCKMGTRTKGSIILAPLSLKQIACLDKKVIIQKVLSAVELALKKESDVICLAGALGDFLPIIKTQIKRRAYFITGRKFLISNIIDNVLKISEIANIQLEKEKISFLNLNSVIGRVCAQILEKKVGKIGFFDKKRRKKNNFSELENIPSKKIEISDSISNVIEGSKIIINTSLFISDSIIRSIGPKSIFIDAIVPYFGATALSKIRNDILIIEAAWSSRGPLQHKALNLFMPKDTIHCCIAEATMFGLEQNIQNNFLEVNFSNVMKVRRISEKYGFCLPRFRSNNKILTNEIVKKIVI